MVHDLELCLKAQVLECRVRLQRVMAEARKLEHQYPHALKVEYRGS